MTPAADSDLAVFLKLSSSQAREFLLDLCLQQNWRRVDELVVAWWAFYGVDLTGDADLQRHLARRSASEDQSSASA
jgi:hypothetical protein